MGKGVYVMAAAAGLVLVTLACVVVAVPSRAYSRLKPPAEVHSVEGFRSFLPNPRAIVKVTLGGEASFIVLGEQPLASFSEFPAGYLFNERGEFVDWRVEASDICDLAPYWLATNAEVRAGRTLTYDDVHSYINENTLASD